MADLIFVSMEDWDDVWRRNQFLCAGLARRFPDQKILFVGLPRNVSHQLRRGRLSALRAEPDWSPPGLPNITVTRPWKLLPNSVDAGRCLNEAMFRAHVRRAARRLRLHAPILWLNPHSAVHMAGRTGEQAVVYDITDDWISPNQDARLRRLTTAQDAQLCARADAVIVCSRKLHDMKRPLTRTLHLIPNGVELDHYRRVHDTDAPLPAVVSAWPKPVLGYTGTIHPERVDVALVETLAQNFPCGTVALVGPNLLPPADQARLQALGNVVLTGPMPYSQLPDYMRAFDVCITPHCMTPFTESLNPIKLWEYLASGKPIASTDVAGFRDYPQFVHLAADPTGFVDACRAALAETGGSTERIAEARKHTWDRRLDCVVGVLEGLENKHASK